LNNGGMDMVDRMRQMMDPGQVVATPAALAALEAAGESATTYVARHLAGDWGTTGTYDAVEVTDRERQYGAMATDDGAKLNRLAVEADNGSRVLSTFVLADGTDLWVSTEGQGEHRNTCVLLPGDY
jgi:hypothetical protein